MIRGASGNDVDLTQERLLYPEHQVEQLGLEATFNEKGLVISGGLFGVNVTSRILSKWIINNCCFILLICVM